MSTPATPSSRRQFLKRATTATAATAAATWLRTPVYGQNQAPAAGRVLGANDRIVVAVVGLKRGEAHITGHLGVKNVEISHVCDVDSERIASVQKLVSTRAPGRTAAGERDFRRLLENKDIDVISIATPNYWHAIMSILACEAGKHVYVEKPGSHNAHEAESMVAAAARHRRVAQMGNQMRSYSFFREAIQRLHEGVIGRVAYARCWYKADRGSMGTGKPAPVPAKLDWALWQGPCPERPYVDNLVHYNWHWLWHYGGGEMANNGIHTLDLARWGLRAEYPVKVSYLGGRYHFRDDQETPDTGAAVFDFGAGGVTWDQSSCDPRKGEANPTVAFYGDKGSLTFPGGNAYVIYDPAGKEVFRTERAAASHIPHFQNFADAIREGKPLYSPISEGQKSTMLCHLANIAYRTGSVLEVDPKTGRIRNQPAAAKYWRREYRPGWAPKDYVVG